jgi:hypothetical protein
MGDEEAIVSDNGEFAEAEGDILGDGLFLVAPAGEAGFQEAPSGGAEKAIDTGVEAAGDEGEVIAGERENLPFVVFVFFQSGVDLASGDIDTDFWLEEVFEGELEL